jgi:hypothetical protein
MILGQTLRDDLLRTVEKTLNIGYPRLQIVAVGSKVVLAEEYIHGKPWFFRSGYSFYVPDTISVEYEHLTRGSVRVQGRVVVGEIEVTHSAVRNLYKEDIFVYSLEAESPFLQLTFEGQFNG